MRVNKSFDIRWGNVQESLKKGTVNVYLQVQNILNTANVVNVYQYRVMQMMMVILPLL